MVSRKQPFAPVLPAIGNEKVINVSRLLRMDICINSYQQISLKHQSYAQELMHTEYAGPYSMYGKHETASHPCIASNRE